MPTTQTTQYNALKTTTGEKMRAAMTGQKPSPPKLTGKKKKTLKETMGC